MEEIVRVTLLGLLFGTFGTTIGGILGCFFNFDSNKKISFVLEVAARSYAFCNLF